MSCIQSVQTNIFKSFTSSEVKSLNTSIMQIPRISAGTLLAAACGSVMTLTMQWGYAKYFGTNVKLERRGIAAINMIEGNRVAVGEKESACQNDSEGDNNMHRGRSQKIAQETSGVHVQVVAPLPAGNAPKSKGNKDGETQEVGTSNAKIQNNTESDENDSNCKNENSVPGGHAATLQTGNSGMGKRRKDKIPIVETAEIGISAKPETANKKLATEESGFCKGDEDIILVDRRLINLMIQATAELETRLRRYEGGSGSNISILDQLFQGKPTQS